MKRILEKLTKLEVSMAAEKGPFDLFALFLREDEFDKWDLVACSTWIERDYRGSLDYVAKKLNSALTTDELIRISKVVLIDEFDERVKNIQRVITVEHTPTELRDRNFFGLRVDLAYVITSKCQADKRLAQLIWKLLTEMWQSGERAVYVGDILAELKKKGETVPVGYLRRALAFLINSECIRAAKFVDRDGIREHGAMTITWVSPYCSNLESLST